MIYQEGPLPMSAQDAFKRIEQSFKAHGKELRPSIEKTGEVIHVSLKGVVFNYWASLDEEVCLFNIKDTRTLAQKHDSQWLESIGAEVFKNADDAQSWVEREVEKYCETIPRKYR